MRLFGLEFGGKTQQVEESTSAQLPISELAEMLADLPNIKEAFLTQADIELALEDRFWINLSDPNNKHRGELDHRSRQAMIGKSRMYWQRDPLAKQAVRLWTDYSVGNGITFTAKDDKVQKTLNQCWNDRRNRAVFSSAGQRKNSNKLLIDGDLFFAVFSGSEGSKLVRMIDPVQITDIISDPDDIDHILAYRREVPGGKALFYADWTADDESKKLAEQQKVPGSQQQVKLEENVVIYHHAFDPLHRRGNGLLFASLDWSKEHRRFMEARVAITQALAKYAHKLVAKGGKSVIDQIASKLKSSIPGSGATQIERNPPSTAGSIFAQNGGLELEAMPRQTGASDAINDGRMLKLMHCAGTGIMEHYFGDGANANLATATAMELPMLKQFESYQQSWMDAYRDLFSIILEEEPDADPAEIDIDLPPILSDDLQKLAAALVSIAGVFPEVAVDEVLQMCLVSLGVNNVDMVMKKVAEKREELAQQKATDAAAMQKMMAVKPGSPLPTKESYDALAKSFSELAQSLNPN